MRALIWMVLIASIWGSALAVVQVSQETRQLHTAVHHLNQQQNLLAIELGRLLLEQGALAAPMRLEQQAQTLNFEPPSVQQLFVMPEGQL